MRYACVIFSLFLFLLFISFKKPTRSIFELHKFIQERLNEAGTRNYILLEKTVQDIETEFETPTDTLANLYHRLGAAYFNNDLEFKAIPAYQKALYIRRKVLSPHDFDLSKTLQGLGRTLGRVRQAEEGIPHLEENLKIRLAICQPQSDTVAEALMMCGNGYIDLGDYTKAHTYLSKALNIFEQNKTDSDRWAYSYQYRGAAKLLSKNYTESIEDFKKAIFLMKKSGDIEGLSECNHNIGEALSEQKLYAQALPYFEKAQALKPHSEYLNQTAFAYCQLKQYTKAHQYIEKAFDFAYKNTNICYLYIPNIYITLGDVLRSENKPLEALTAYNQSLQLFLNDTISIQKHPLSALPPLESNTMAKAASCRPDILKVLKKKSIAFEYLYLTTQDKNYLQQALNNYRLCESLVQDMLHSFSEENSRFFWTEDVKDIYEKGIKTALLLKNNEAALAFAESSRAFNLLKEVQTHKAKHFGGVPDSLLVKEQKLKTTIAFWQKIAADPTNDSTRMAQSREGLWLAKEQFEDFQKQLERLYPHYHKLKYQKNTPLSISDLQKGLNEEKAFIEYFIGDSMLYTFVIDSKGFHIFDKKINIDFYQNISDLRKATGDFNFIKNKPDSAQILYLHSANYLYNILISNILDNKKRLTIVSDGALAYIPFDLLLTQEARSWRDSETPFLLRKMAISYAYSLRLLNENIDNTPSVSGNFGGFGISYDAQKFIFSAQEKQNEKITPLKHTVEEVKAIKNKIGGQTWLDEQATKQNFNENAPKRDMLHLAMHGFLNPNDPLSSGLIFSRLNASDSSNYLTGYDLYATQLKAKLAVLSACNTGDGQLRGREGVMSLARSFAFAGCESLIMSLWSVPDKTTSEIMVQFYDNLKKGVPKDIALQQAKLSHLDNAEPSRRIPNNWAAMVVIGNIEPLTWQAWWQNGWLLVSIAGFMAILFVFSTKISHITHYWNRKKSAAASSPKPK